MIKSMYSGVSGLRAHQAKMDVVGNNIANVNTAGYKSSRVTFSDVFTQTNSTATAPADDGTIGGMNPQQIGLGVTVNSIDLDFNAGSPQDTGRTLDVALSGDGFFAIMNPSGETLYTRLGAFEKDGGDNGGNLVIAGTGHFVLDSDGQKINVSGYTNVQIDQRGNVLGLDDSNDVQIIATIQVANFINPGGLEKVGGSMYKATQNSGEPLADDDLIAGNNGTGLLSPGYLEMSNVDLAREFTELIVTQRGYQANSRVITTSDTLLEELINLKR